VSSIDFFEEDLTFAYDKNKVLKSIIMQMTGYRVSKTSSFF